MGSGTPPPGHPVHLLGSDTPCRLLPLWTPFSPLGSDAHARSPLQGVPSPLALALTALWATVIPLDTAYQEVAKPGFKPDPELLATVFWVKS